MVKHINFTYSDIKSMTRKERKAYQDFFINEINSEKENVEKLKDSSK